MTSSTTPTAGPAAATQHLGTSGQPLTTDAEMLGWAKAAGLHYKDEKMLLSRIKKTPGWEGMMTGEVTTSMKQQAKKTVEKVTAGIIKDRQRGEAEVGKDAFKWNKLVRKTFNKDGEWDQEVIEDPN